MHSFTFINDPEPRSIAQYHDAVATVLDLLRKGPDVKAVYLAGGKWMPGISDIDLMVVFPDDAIPPAPLFSPRRLSEETAYCFTHNMGTYDETSFAHLFFIIPDLTRLECISGTPISVEDPRT
ncbi:MAG: nucleotidyltransferase domain-containing protein, partial [Parcubacteria group bacterium]|nr:nucleotidyltransferase domain-containing protein [Parcubacteria group bacterium]